MGLKLSQGLARCFSGPQASPAEFALDGAAANTYIPALARVEVSMKEPEDMTLGELRTELRQMGVTERLTTLILREMGAAEQRIQKAMKASRDAKTKYDPLRAQLYVLKAHGMTNSDLS